MTRPDACGAHKVFERDTFAQTPRAEVWCEQPTGHSGAHEATLARVSYCWATDHAKSADEES